MNKPEFVEKMAEASGLSRNDCEKAYDAFLKTTSDYLVNGEKVVFVGFGKFEVMQHAERQGHNPRTGEPLTIPAKKAIKFNAGQVLEKAVNKA